MWPADWAALSGLCLFFGQVTQGVALGWLRPRRWRSGPVLQLGFTLQLGFALQRGAAPQWGNGKVG